MPYCRWKGCQSFFLYLASRALEWTKLACLFVCLAIQTQRVKKSCIIAFGNESGYPHIPLNVTESLVYMKGDRKSERVLTADNYINFRREEMFLNLDISSLITWLLIGWTDEMNLKVLKKVLRWKMARLKYRLSNIYFDCWKILTTKLPDFSTRVWMIYQLGTEKQLFS